MWKTKKQFDVNTVNIIRGSRRRGRVNRNDVAQGKIVMTHSLSLSLYAKPRYQTTLRSIRDFTTKEEGKIQVSQGTE